MELAAAFGAAREVADRDERGEDIDPGDIAAAIENLRRFRHSVPPVQRPIASGSRRARDGIVRYAGVAARGRAHRPRPANPGCGVLERPGTEGSALPRRRRRRPLHGPRLGRARARFADAAGMERSAGVLDEGCGPGARTTRAGRAARAPEAGSAAVDRGRAVRRRSTGAAPGDDAETRPPRRCPSQTTRPSAAPARPSSTPLSASSRACREGLPALQDHASVPAAVLTIAVSEAPRSARSLERGIKPSLGLASPSPGRGMSGTREPRTLRSLRFGQGRRRTMNVAAISRKSARNLLALLSARVAVAAVSASPAPAADGSLLGCG